MKNVLFLLLSASLGVAGCNSDGSFGSSASASTVPGSPAIGAATAGNGSASVAFTAPSSNGGSAITSYTASCGASGISTTATGTTSPITVSGLTDGTTYSCTVAATNSVGTGAASGSVSVTPTATTASGSAYSPVYKSLSWEAAAAVSYSGNCSMNILTTGVPPYHAAYYLAPVSSEYPTAVAQTPVSKTEMSVVPYMASSITGSTATINICPSKAASTTSANAGVIGFMLSGEALFNPYEANGENTPAMSDKVSYTFTDGSGNSQTASFIDTCNSHPTPLTAGYTWHHHGIPNCLTATVDTNDGPSHIIGVALDGFPIYGGRDINGNIIDVSQLDSCNGITSATPEFPSGAYHYVLPLNVTGKQSSLNCYSGTVTETQMALAKALACAARQARAALPPAAPLASVWRSIRPVRDTKPTHLTVTGAAS